MYWILVKHITMFIITCYWPKFIGTITNRDYIGLLDYVDVRGIQFISFYLRFHRNLIQILQVIMALLYATKGITITQTPLIIWYDAYGAYVMFIVTLVIKWIRHTFKNYVYILRVHVQIMNEEYHQLLRRYVISRRRLNIARIRANRPRPAIQEGIELTPEQETKFMQEVNRWEQDRNIARRLVNTLLVEYNNLDEEVQQRLNELAVRYSIIEELERSWI